MLEKLLEVGKTYNFFIPSYSPKGMRDGDFSMTIFNNLFCKLGDNSALYIPWIDNEISINDLRGSYDIFSGRFTGCWMVYFELKGKKYVGHIGTQEGYSHAKQIWNEEITTRCDFHLYDGFRPHLGYTIKEQIGNSVWGLISFSDRDGPKKFSILANSSDGRLKIISIKQATGKLSRLGFNRIDGESFSQWHFF